MAVCRTSISRPCACAAAYWVILHMGFTRIGAEIGHRLILSTAGPKNCSIEWHSCMAIISCVRLRARAQVETGFQKRNPCENGCSRGERSSLSIHYVLCPIPALILVKPQDPCIRLIERMSHSMFKSATMPSKAELAIIETSTLIVWGDRDQFLPVEQAVTLYRWMPTAQLAVIPNADHMVTRTHQAEFGRIVTNFLDNLSHGETR
jgi:pimeloyl-ACP methyl ester carboxylesterase